MPASYDMQMMPQTARADHPLKHPAHYNGGMPFRSIALALCLCLCACQRDNDPLALALASTGHIANPEAVVPPQCYTKTDGRSNPCWVCHTQRNGRNALNDVDLQKKYDFSDQAKTNPWTNLFADLRPVTAQISDSQALAYVRADNYTPLRAAVAHRKELTGWKPDLDFVQGFDEQGFARDGSWWRAFRYSPFPGTFWPTNGSTDDVMIRLPRVYRLNRKAEESLEIYKINLAIAEAAVATDERRPDAQLNRRIEPVDETIAGFDVDGDGKLSHRATRLRKLPLTYAGAAGGIAVMRYQYPLGTEFLHSVRYLDPDAPGHRALRMKELRYAAKVRWMSDDSLQRAYAEEAVEKEKDILPAFIGTPASGLLSPFGWQFQAYIEDAQGRLRLQTHEEHTFCMGCHSTLGVTVDSSFSFPRKVPGLDGWRYQSLDGIPDLPQSGQRDPEILTYLRRVQGGDEIRANEEMLQRFFPNGRLDEARVRAARDLRDLIVPSRERALALDKAYMARVREQNFEHGRDTVLAPAANVHTHIENEDTALAKHGAIYDDGRLWLQWPD